MNKNHFHVNGFALSLALKERLGRTRKWPQLLRFAKVSAVVQLSHVTIVLHTNSHTTSCTLIVCLFDFSGYSAWHVK